MEKLTKGDFLVRQSDESLWEFLGYDEGHMEEKAEGISFIGKPKNSDELENKQYVLVRKVSFDNPGGKDDTEWLGADDFRKVEKH